MPCGTVKFCGACSCHEWTFGGLVYSEGHALYADQSKVYRGCLPLCSAAVHPPAYMCATGSSVPQMLLLRKRALQ